MRFMMCVVAYAATVVVAGGARAQCPGPQADPQSAGLVGCAVACNCKFRVTMTRAPLVKPERTDEYFNGRVVQRFQSCTGGVPRMSLLVEDQVNGAASLPGNTHHGSVQIRIDHIDICAQCAANCTWAGWSQPQFRFTGRTQGAASYESFTQMQADFTLLSGASRTLAVAEAGSSMGFGFNLALQVQVTPGTSPASVARVTGSLTFPTTLPNPPNGRAHIAPWKVDYRLGLQETLLLIGMQYSTANADANPLSPTRATASARVTDAMFCAGVRYRCVCRPSSHATGTGGATGSGVNGSGGPLVGGAPQVTGHTGGTTLTGPPSNTPIASSQPQTGGNQ